MIVIEPGVWLDADGRHDTRSGTDVITPLTDSEADALTLAQIANGIHDLRTMQTQAAGLIDASDTLAAGADTAPAAYSQAVTNAIIKAIREIAARQSAILRALSGEVMDDVIGLAQLAAREIRES